MDAEARDPIYVYQLELRASQGDCTFDSCIKDLQDIKHHMMNMLLRIKVLAALCFLIAAVYTA